MTISIVKIVLRAIKNYCINKGDNCNNCPFNIEDSWHEYCMFMGDIPHEGTTPDDWKLDKVDFKDDMDDYAIRKQNLGSKYGSSVESDTDS